MSGSYRIQHQPKLEPQETVCDYCNNATALIYCTADTAKLCFSCDFEVHATNDLFSKHTRSQICDLCDAGPASIFCETERSVFCQNCDWEKHSVAELSMHSRRPVEGYTGCPSVSDLMGILGFDDLGVKKSMFLSDGSIDSEVVGSSREDGFSDLLIWSTPSALSFSNLIASCDSRNDFKALDVPPLPKNRNATCGQRKEEILYQLRELARSKANASYKDSDSNELFQLLSAQTWQRQDSYAVCDPYKQEEDVLCWFNNTHGDQNQGFHHSTLASSNCEESFVVPDKQSNIGASTSNVANADCETDLQQSLAARSLQVIPKTGFHELNSQERDSAISRYKEKRKTRRYDKHIRYESRKLRAETRTRIKGRFAKV